VLRDKQPVFRRIAGQVLERCKSSGAPCCCLCVYYSKSGIFGQPKSATQKVILKYYLNLSTLVGTNSVQPHYKSPSEPGSHSAFWVHKDCRLRVVLVLDDVDIQTPARAAVESLLPCPYQSLVKSYCRFLTSHWACER
jgi:hypothetical protein